MNKWPTLELTEVFKAHVFKYFKVKRQSPLTKEIGEFDIVQCANWVNVIAITPEKKIVLIKQYRHGIDAETIEIPGGAVNKNEATLLAAQRELQEETGYTSRNWTKLGQLDVNPAFMTNYCETYLALDALKTHQQNPIPDDVWITDSLPSLKITSPHKNPIIIFSQSFLLIYFPLSASSLSGLAHDRQRLPVHLIHPQS